MVRIIESPLPPLSNSMWHEPATRSTPPMAPKEPERDKDDRHDGVDEKALAPPPWQADRD